MATSRQATSQRQALVRQAAHLVEGNYSIFEGNFEDESHSVKHSHVGMLGMCKKRGMQHTNECQFYVTLTAPMPFLDSKNYVAFGRVVEGLRTFNLINKLETAPNERPLTEVKILGCGKYMMKARGRLQALQSHNYSEAGEEKSGFK